MKRMKQIQHLGGVDGDGIIGIADVADLIDRLLSGN